MLSLAASTWASVGDLVDIYIYVILFPLLGDASLMLGGDSMVDAGDCLIL